jgi:hypothetical protein
MFRSVTWTFAALLVVVGSSSCMWGDPEPSPNIQPEINAFTVGGEPVQTLRVREGEKLMITVIVWDGNGDKIVEENFTWEAELGSIDGFGPSVRYEPPTDIVWEDPPQLIIDRVTITVTDGQPGSEPVTRFIDVEILPPCPADNQEPIIHSITPLPEMIDLGDRSTITIVAEDPEGEDLTFEWTPPFGYIEGTGATVDWVSTDVCCTAYYDIEVVVSDGCKETWTYVSVYVNV